MPIMGGIEASNKIHHYLEGENFQSILHLSRPSLFCNSSQKPFSDLSSLSEQSEQESVAISISNTEKTLIYALTADISDSAIKKMKEGSFDRILGYLDCNEIKKILLDI